MDNEERCEDDYTLTPSGPLGGLVSVGTAHEFVGEYGDTEQALAVVRERMENEQYWPQIWWVSDHGNEWMIDANGKEIANG